MLEIYEKEIYKQHHCRTIHEYGFRYAKLSKEMVDKAIRTLKHLEGKPALKKIIETQGIHKVAMVATIATPENERVLAKHVENLSKPALFEFSKELRYRQQKEKLADQEVMFVGQTEEALRMVLKRSDEVVDEAEVKVDGVGDGCQIKGNGVGGKDGIKEGEVENRGAVASVKNKVVETRADRGNSVPGNGTVKHHDAPNNSKPISKIAFPSRYIHKKKDREIRAKYQHKCAYPGCVKTIDVMHHRVSFAFERSHESVIPLCNVHHEFAHKGMSERSGAKSGAIGSFLLGF